VLVQIADQPAGEQENQHEVHERWVRIEVTANAAPMQVSVLMSSGM
jgi:hypothetical protein